MEGEPKKKPHRPSEDNTFPPDASLEAEDAATEVDPSGKPAPLNGPSARTQDRVEEPEVAPPPPGHKAKETCAGAGDRPAPAGTGQESVPARTGTEPAASDDSGNRGREHPATRQSARGRAALPDTESATYRAVTANTVFGRFHLLMEMGQGGMATLYLARIRGPKKFEKLVAIKKIHDHLSGNPEFINMFLDEARIAARIHHPNVATIFDLGKIRGSHYIAMEYVHGQNLTDILRSSVRQRIPFPWAHAVCIVADAAAGLHAAHELRDPDGELLNVVHRDVSPQNILVSYDGHVKVVDFGVAYAREKLTQTAVGTVKGKAAYMSPEQTRGEKADRRSDVFALGTVLWESVCIRRLFREKDDTATLLKVRKAQIPRPRAIRPELPATLERIILKALARDKEDRYASAGQMAEELQELLVKEGAPFGAQKLARYMDTIFHDRKKIKNEQIQKALKADSPETVRGVAMVDSSGSSLDLPRVDTGDLKAMPKRRSLAMTLVAGAVFAAGAFILALALLYRPGSSTSRGKTGLSKDTRKIAHPSTRPSPPAARKRASVAVSVKIKPESAAARVTFRGKKYEGTTFQMVVPRSGTPETLEVRAKGYLPRSLVVVPLEDSEVTITLNPRPRPGPRKPRPRKTSPRKLLRDLPM